MKFSALPISTSETDPKNCGSISRTKIGDLSKLTFCMNRSTEQAIKCKLGHAAMLYLCRQWPSFNTL